MSSGKNVTEYCVVPLSAIAGAMVPSVQTKLPGTLPAPPDKAEAESVCPKVIAEAPGNVRTDVDALFTVSLTVVVVVT